MPKDLLDQIRELEDLFTVDSTKLKQVVDHFIKELEKGLSYLFNRFQRMETGSPMVPVGHLYPWLVILKLTLVDVRL